MLSFLHIMLAAYLPCLVSPSPLDQEVLHVPVQTSVKPLKAYGLPVTEKWYGWQRHWDVNIGIGSDPAQVIFAVIDLRWADFWVVSTKCNTTEQVYCANHLRYNSTGSSTYVGNGTQFEFAYSLSPQLKGFLSYDTISLGSGIRIPHQPIVELTTWQGYPHEYDAVLGLAPGRGPIWDNDNPEYDTLPGLESVFLRMANSNAAEQALFSLLLPEDEHDVGDLSFGVVHEDFYEGELIRRDLVPLNDKVWAWDIKAPDISLRDPNGTTLRNYSLYGYRARLDTVFSQSIGLPIDVVRDINDVIGAVPQDNCHFIVEIPCAARENSPDLVLSFDGHEVIIDAQTYIRREEGFPFCRWSPDMCSPQLGGIDPARAPPWLGNDTILLGEPFLKAVYSIYDWDQKTVSFAKARRPHLLEK